MTAHSSNPPPQGQSRWVRLLMAIIARVPIGSMLMTAPDGRVYRFAGALPGPHVDLLLRKPAAARRMVLGGHLGFADAYLDGEWDTSDLTQLIEYFALAQDNLGPSTFLETWVMRVLNRFSHLRNENTKTGSRRNIMAHYDLGNQFYGRWLDPSMTYSAALFTHETPTLEAAQQAKYRRLADSLRLAPDHHVLEIGCGWGGFAEFAAKERGCRITGITISPAQLDFAKARIQREGLGDKVDLKLLDYRDVSGSFDRIASIEMIEAVGETYWPTYFQTLRDRLKPGGVAGLQAITIADRLFSEYRRGTDFIQRYIFPGGMLPAPGVLRQFAERFGFHWRDELSFGPDYGRTLATWRDRFEQAWPEIQPLGFDERFKRLWTYYLCYCEAGFRYGGIDVVQISLQRA